MQRFGSTEAKRKWERITEVAKHEPVTITHQGRPALVVTSARDYNDLLRLKYDQLKEDIQQASEQAENGQVTTLSSEQEISAFFEKIKTRAHRRLGTSRNHEQG